MTERINRSFSEPYVSYGQTVSSTRFPSSLLTRYGYVAGAMDDGI